MPSEDPLQVECATRSDVGLRREVNQDSLAVSCGIAGPLGREHFFVVADGMGAHAAGELASKIAVDTVPLAYFKRKQMSAPAALRRAVREANARIHAKGASEPEFHGMGTTCSCLALSRAGALAAHVGDSRVYRLRDGVLEQLTFDHSLVWEMADAIDATEAEVPAYIPKNVITRSLGPHEKVKIDIEGPHEVQEGDVFLLCSDGLCGVVSDPILGAVMGAMGVETAAQTLVDLANLHGGPDNISAILARVTRLPSGEEGEDVELPPAEGMGQVFLGAMAAIVCLGAFTWFLSIDNALGMLFSAAACGASVVFASFRRSPEDQQRVLGSLGGPYGNGPYRSCDCRTPRDAAEALHQLVEELSMAHGAESADESESALWQSGATLRIDWGTYERRKQEADRCWQEERYGDAVVAFADLLRDVMNEARGEE